MGGSCDGADDVIAVILDRGELTAGSHRGAAIQVSGNKWPGFLPAWRCRSPFTLHLGKGSGAALWLLSLFLSFLSTRRDINKPTVAENWGLKDYRGPQQQTVGVYQTSFYTLEKASKAPNKQIESAEAPQPHAI